jgi:hypothetical protein
MLHWSSKFAFNESFLINLPNLYIFVRPYKSETPNVSNVDPYPCIRSLSGCIVISLFLLDIYIIGVVHLLTEPPI